MMPQHEQRLSLIRLIVTLTAVTMIMLSLAFMTGCEERLSGCYAEASGFGALEFRDDGTVYVTLGLAGSTFVGSYEVDGDKVIIAGPGGSQVYTIAEDGSIEGGMGLRYQLGRAAPVAAGRAANGTAPAGG